MHYKKKYTGEKFIKSKVTSYEDKIQQEIFIHLQNNYCTKIHEPRCLVFAVPNQNQWKLTNIGVLAGVSDLIFVTPKMHYYLEVKTNDGKQRNNQKDFEQRIKDLGYEYYVVRSINDLPKFEL